MKDESFGFVDFKNTKHRYILSLCYQLNWTCVHPKLKRVVVDTARLGRWVREKSKCKKPIKQHTDEELGTLIKAMEVMLINRSTTESRCV